MRVFAVSGLSGTGKTTLVEQLVQALKSGGYSVATVKSSKEDYSSPEGTDSWRHERAGANPVILLGPNTTSIRYAKRLKISQVLQGQNVDFLLIEGMKEEQLPRIWCVGNRTIDPKGIPPMTVAIVTWEYPTVNPKGVKEPIYAINEIERLSQVVIKEAVDITALRI
jgi:molybdopterin-guanine dinucleotide biosynthesis protein B